MYIQLLLTDAKITFSEIHIVSVSIQSSGK